MREETERKTYKHKKYEKIKQEYVQEGHSSKKKMLKFRNRSK